MQKQSRRYVVICLVALILGFTAFLVGWPPVFVAALVIGLCLLASAVIHADSVILTTEMHLAEQRAFNRAQNEVMQAMTGNMQVIAEKAPEPPSPELRAAMEREWLGPQVPQKAKPPLELHVFNPNRQNQPEGTD